MKWKQRPSHKELQNKILQAKQALSEKKYLFGPNLDKLVEEFMDLNIGNAEEIWSLINELIEEIKIDDYAGTHPPMKSLEPNLNCELFVFVWDSKRMNRKMYLKFAIKEGFQRFHGR